MVRLMRKEARDSSILLDPCFLSKLFLARIRSSLDSVVAVVATLRSLLEETFSVVVLTTRDSFILLDPCFLSILVLARIRSSLDSVVAVVTTLRSLRSVALSVISRQIAVVVGDLVLEWPFLLLLPIGSVGKSVIFPRHSRGFTSVL